MMDEQPESSDRLQVPENQELPPTPKAWISGWAKFVLFSGIFSLIILWLISQVDDYGKGGAESFMDGVFLGFCALALVVLQVISFVTGMVYLSNVEKIRGNRRGIIFAATGMICSLIYAFLLFLPRYLDAREQERLPKEYKMWFPWVEDSLKTYKKHHGEYPPALMPYLVPRFWEHASAFPPDEYHKPGIQRYWHMNYGPHQWMDHGTTMSADVTPKDFDFTGYYRYYSDGKGYILIGNGPDCDADLDAKESFLAARRGDMNKLIENKYDPTNGMNSGGDYWAMKLR